MFAVAVMFPIDTPPSAIYLNVGNVFLSLFVPPLQTPSPLSSPPIPSTHFTLM